MELLKERIRKDGVMKPGNVVELTRKKNGKTLRELFADGRKEEE